ncbi:MAG: hypothetical protein AAF197_03520 [Pseudomonadota bacterium]
MTAHDDSLDAWQSTKLDCEYDLAGGSETVKEDEIKETRFSKTPEYTKYGAGLCFDVDCIFRVTQYMPSNTSNDVGVCRQIYRDPSDKQFMKVELEKPGGWGPVGELFPVLEFYPDDNSLNPTTKVSAQNLSDVNALIKPGDGLQILYWDVYADKSDPRRTVYRSEQLWQLDGQDKFVLARYNWPR